MPFQFHGQRSSEEVVLLTRQHPFVLLHALLASTFILLLPLVANIFMNFTPAFAGILIACLVIGASHGLLTWYAWNNTLLLLTSERVVWLHQKSLIHREFSECGIRSIRQVSHEVKGWMHTLFGYGNISISTGGAQAPFLLPNVPDPYEVQQEILRVAAGEGFIEE